MRYEKHNNSGRGSRCHFGDRQPGYLHRAARIESNCGLMQVLILDNIRGLKQKVFNPGYNFKIPFIQIPITYDCRLKPIDISVATGTKDLQTVSISLRILQQPIV